MPDKANACYILLSSWRRRPASSWCGDWELGDDAAAAAAADDDDNSDDGDSGGGDGGVIIGLSPQLSSAERARITAARAAAVWSLRRRTEEPPSHGDSRASSSTDSPVQVYTGVYRCIQVHIHRSVSPSINPYILGQVMYWSLTSLYVTQTISECILLEKYIYILALETASPGNQAPALCQLYRRTFVTDYIPASCCTSLFTARRYASAAYAVVVGLSVSSVRPSVTSRYCRIETTGRIELVQVAKISKIIIHMQQ